MELIEASKVHETIIDYRDKATDVESEIELERAYGANDVGKLISQLPVIEAIPKVDYETRLKADMVAVFEELKAEIEELDTPNNSDAYMTCAEVIQQKIDKLKENIEEAVLHIIMQRDTGGQNGR